jgi:UDP-N-acetylglucosamine 1-carboxyvinyltransferase
MSTLLIEGGTRLEGRVAVEGNKNAALPLLAACLLTDEECVLTNVPRIGDVEVMARLLVDVGAEVDGIGTTTLRVRSATLRTHEPDRSLVGRLRGSVLLLGPLLARLGQARLALDSRRCARRLAPADGSTSFSRTAQTRSSTRERMAGGATC